MSNINSISQENSSEQKISLDYNIQESSSLSSSESLGSNAALRLASTATYGDDQTYSVPLGSLRKETNNTLIEMNTFLKNLENLLRQINLSPYNNPKLEESHIYIWNEINKKEDSFPKIEIENYLGELRYPTPSFICFDQYIYAEDVQTRGYRKFVKEYDNLISNSSFGHIYDFREIIKYLLNEVTNIKLSLIKDFGVDYEDEAQQQVAAYYLYWLKMATHYKELFTKAITASPTGIPEAEVDKTTKKQAAQFQAFFSIRVNSLTTSIDSQLDSLHKDLVTHCDVFYQSYLGPALRFKTKVTSDFALDLRTSQMVAEMPRLSEEVAIAVLSAEGNFKSVLTDLLERRNSTSQKIDLIYQSITQRRKYTSYISQLSIKAIQKAKIVTSNVDSRYASLLSNIYVDGLHSSSLQSSHSLLDDLSGDSHPQYLLRSGGIINGNISVENNAKIDGVQIKTHSHDGVDGSLRISSLDIDYTTVRNEIGLNASADEITISIDSYQPDILQGGVPVADVNISIDIPDSFKDKYDFEILYVEI